jgi:hypothetical protein
MRPIKQQRRRRFAIALVVLVLTLPAATGFAGVGDLGDRVTAAWNS